MENRNSIQGIKVYVKPRFKKEKVYHKLFRYIEKDILILEIRSGNNILEYSSEGLDINTFMTKVKQKYGDNIYKECMERYSNNGELLKRSTFKQ